MDWTERGARQNSVVARKHGLKARAVICKHQESYLMIYDRGEADFHQKLKSVKADPDWQGDIVRRVHSEVPKNPLDQIAAALRDD